VDFEVNMDHSSEGEFDRHMIKNFDEVIENIKDTRKITLKEVQLALNFKK